MLYVYAPVIQEGTKELIEALGARRLTRFDGMRFVNKGQPIAFDEKEDTIVCWGSYVPQIGKLRIFNKSLLFPNKHKLNENIGKVVPRSNTYRPGTIIPWTGTLLAGQYYGNDPDYSYVVPQEDFPGYAQPFYSGKHEYTATVIGGAVQKVSTKAAERKICNSELYTYDSSKHAHAWYRKKEHGWKIEPVNLIHCPNIVAHATKLAAALEFDFVIIGYMCPAIDGYSDGYGHNVVRKIDPSPLLTNPEQLAFMVSTIKTWITNNGGKL